MGNPGYLKHNKKPDLQISTFSHRGLVRANNEDNLAVYSYTTNDADSRQVLLAILADGVGGHKAGEVASRIGMETIASVVAGCENLKDPAALLEKAITTTNQSIVEQAQENESWKGMGSTCVCALMVDRQLTIANLGDSRLYLVRERTIRQLTYDHTWLEEISNLNLAGADKITRSHPLAHVLNRYLGSREPIRVDLRIRPSDQAVNLEMQENQILQIMPEDILILASDGISDLLDDRKIMEISLKANWQNIARTLVYFALREGGHDNATAISIKIPKR